MGLIYIVTPYGRGIANKVPVVGLVEHAGKRIGRVVETTTASALQDLIAKNVIHQTTIMTDDHLSYTGLEKRGYKHHVVKHSRRGYVNGLVHTNNVESFWALFRRGLHGTYHNVSKKHLQRYINEFAFRSGAGAMALSFMDAV